MLFLIIAIIIIIILWPIITFLYYKYGPENKNNIDANVLVSICIGFCASALIATFWFIIIPLVIIFGVVYFLARKYLPILDKKFDQITQGINKNEQ